MTIAESTLWEVMHHGYYKVMNTKLLFAALVGSVGLSMITGCFHHHHDDDHYADAGPGGVVIVDADHHEHHGYYDNDHAWHGGFYDDQHNYHEDARDWHGDH